MVDSTGVSYPLADSRGTPMAWVLFDGSVAVQGYGAFGEEGPANIGRFGFTGHVCGADRTTPLTRRYDPRVRLPEIGLDYYKARFYDPSIGRFLTPDPAGTIDSPNLYAYVLNDPVNFTDPSGLVGVTSVCTCVFRPGGSVGTTGGDARIPGFAIPGGLFCYQVILPAGGFQGDAPSGPGTPAPTPGMMEEMPDRTRECASRQQDLMNRMQTLRSFNAVLTRFAAVQTLLAGPSAGRLIVDGNDYVNNRPGSPNRFGFPLAAATLVAEGVFGGLSEPFQEGRDRLAADTLKLVGEFTALCLNG